MLLLRWSLLLVSTLQSKGWVLGLPLTSPTPANLRHQGGRVIKTQLEDILVPLEVLKERSAY